VKMFDAGKTRMIVLPYGEKKYDDMLSPFYLIPERHGQTERQTDGETERISISLSRVAHVWTCKMFFLDFQLYCRASAIYMRDTRKRRVRPSVCPSVTRWYWLKTNKHRIVRFPPLCSPVTLLFDTKLHTTCMKGLRRFETRLEW